MTSFAELDDNNIVLRVLSVEQDFISTGKLGDPAKWKKTSYNIRGGVYYEGGTNIIATDQSVINDDAGRKRKNHAGIGYKYDETRDAFIPPQPFPSWTLNESSCDWESPVPYPDDGEYYWNEDTTSWDEFNS